MNPNDPQDRQQTPISQPQPTSISSPQKEVLPPVSKEPAAVNAGEYEPPKEVAHIVTIKQDHMEIPPDIKQMGVTASPSTMPVSSVVTTTAALPLTDDQIEEGLHENLTSGYRWLAQWCEWQLKKIHIHLKKVHGHFMRIMDK